MTDTNRRYDTQLGFYIDGEWITADRETQPVVDPGNGTRLGDVPLATTADLDRTMEAAERGFRLWRTTPPQERATVLRRTAALMRKRADRLATIATLEEGNGVDPVSPDRRRLVLGTEPDELAGRSELQT